MQEKQEALDFRHQVENNSAKGGAENDFTPQNHVCLHCLCPDETASNILHPIQMQIAQANEQRNQFGEGQGLKPGAFDGGHGTT